ncbi:MAG TPA: hypothetical protein VNK04_07655 [Gemmataceae bacterium]|nr:hypothetical protein [Gemmataceae bacterium]
MNCHEVYAWLLVSKTTKGTPREVQRHLRQCRRCRGRRRRLLRLDRYVEQLPAPAEDPGVKARLMQQVEHTTPFRPPGWRRRLLLRLAVALALLLAFSLTVSLLDRRENPPASDPVVGEPGSLPSTKEAEEELVTRFVKHNLSLANTSHPEMQLQVLTSMAGDLQAEACRLAKQGPHEELLLVVRLYEHVLRQGLIGRARSLPPGQRRELLPPVVKLLQESAVTVEQTARDVPPAVAEFLRPMGAVARDVSDTLTNEEKLTAEPPGTLTLPFATGSGTPRTLFAVLVVQGVLLAEDNDPLRRAYYCSDMADQLALSLLIASQRGDHERVSVLGTQLNTVMDQGVAANLARLRKENPDDPRLKELERVIQRTARAVEALEKELAQASSQGNAGPPQVGERRQYEQAKDLGKALKDLDKKLKDITKGKKGPPGKPPPKQEIRGVVKSLDANNGTLVLMVKENGQEFEVTLHLPPGARVRSEPRDIPRDTVKPGLEVKARLREKTTVEELKVELKDR